MSPEAAAGSTLVAGMVVFLVGAVFWRLAYERPPPEALLAFHADLRSLGLGSLAGFVLTRFAGPFNPPILAHVYTGVLGVWLLTQGG